MTLLKRWTRNSASGGRRRAGWRRLPASRLARRVGLLLLRAVVAAHAAFLLFFLLLSLLYTRVNPPITSLMLYRRLRFHYNLQPVRFVPLASIRPEVQRMLVKVEDYRFYRHPGIDLRAIWDAWRVDRALGTRIYGGSTITQQLARTLFLVPDKTYFRKYLEALIALEMDLVMSKDRILELYFNYVEWGKGVFGLGAAAAYYYGQSAASLSRDQSMRLITILSSPIRYSVNTFQKNRLLAERYRYLVSRFAGAGG